MLDLRWCWACVLLVACDDAREEPSERDARVVDASRHDASALDARAPDANLDAAMSPSDARLEDAASDATMDVITTRDWRDVPEGPAATPRELCARSWRVPRLDPRALDGVPIVSFRQLVADADGHTLVAGMLLQSFDFGTGMLTVPSPGSASFLLELDGACELVWAKVFVASAGRTTRSPVSLGFDARGDIALLTASSDGNARNTLEFLTLDTEGKSLAEKVLDLGENTVGLTMASRRGHVLLTDTLGYPGTIDFGAGTPSQPDVGNEFNVLFTTDGTLLRQDVFGTSSKRALVGQRIGPAGELVGWGEEVEHYYGTRLLGPTIAKVDPSGELAWSHELYPWHEFSAMDVKHDIGESGAIALWTMHGDGATLYWEQYLRELAPDGSTTWEVPITFSDTASFFLHGVRMGERSVAALGAIADGWTHVGHSWLRIDDVQRTIVLQLERGGALRWSLTFAEPDYVQAFDVTARDEVVVAGYQDTYVGDVPTFVRIYGR